jgi:hypothetical protein
MTKKVKFNAKPLARPSADQWVSDQPSNEPLKRLTIDVAPSLHKRIKIRCASLDLKMADVIRDLLEKEFPAE